MLAQGDDVRAIPGTHKRSRPDENLGALDVRFSAAELEATETRSFRPMPPLATVTPTLMHMVIV